MMYVKFTTAFLAPSTYLINIYQIKDMKIKRHNDQHLCELYTDDKPDTLIRIHIQFIPFDGYNKPISLFSSILCL